MPTLPDFTARYFPLIARPRPACAPLPARVAHLVDLSDKAAATKNQVQASLAFNQAALLASDIGLPELAREMCHQHASAYLHACPLDATSAKHALEPVVNLARLQIRAARADDGRRQLLDLFDAVSAGRAAEVDGLTIPSDLTTDTGRTDARAWLWAVVLADGARTHTTAGRWTDALAHMEAHRGIGTRMLDGRQVAVLAALAAGTASDAETLLADTDRGEEWEQEVTTCLTLLCRRALGKNADSLLGELVESYDQRRVTGGLIVFNIRLGLTLLGLADADSRTARRLVAALHDRTIATFDGYAARECLTNPAFTRQSSAEQALDCHQVLRASALEARVLEGSFLTALTAALQCADGVIRDSHAGR
ncbi:hypothetical protein [Streptomyces sp. NPDC017964]|uniref:hypothetical protein n=1 Tax=Streptomyces sp. NPDC017964 TaxID=3365022 RepID=UPI00379D700F